MEAAIQTTPAIDRAVSRSASEVRCIRKKIKHVRSNVATVIPEIGLDEDPISPVMRDDTVTNKNPKTTIKIAPGTVI